MSLINYLNYVQGVADQNLQESTRISQLNKQIQDQYKRLSTNVYSAKKNTQ